MDPAAHARREAIEAAVAWHGHDGGEGLEEVVERFLAAADGLVRTETAIGRRGFNWRERRLLNLMRRMGRARDTDEDCWIVWEGIEDTLNAPDWRTLKRIVRQE